MFSPYSLSQAQRGCLDGLSLDNLFHTRKLFVGWAEDGLYDFCSLPFGVKKHMNVLDEDSLSQLPDQFEGNLSYVLTISLCVFTSVWLFGRMCACAVC